MATAVEPRWGVMLVSYEGMGMMNYWIHGDKGVCAFSNRQEADELAVSYKARNPKGFYEVRELGQFDLPE